jgi:ribonuclease T2
MLDVMPSPKLVQHEWSRHGTCSGLSPEDYFARARSAFTSVHIPARYQAPESAFTTDLADVEQSFRAANAALEPEGIAVLCQGRFLREVRVCLTKDLQLRACGHDVKDNCRGEITVRPVK